MTDAAATRSLTARRGLRTGAKVLPEHARAHNRSLVLRTLYHRGAMSRADLSREIGLTRVTISDLVAELIADGFVAEKGVRETSGPGKPATLVDIEREGHAIVGLDLSRSDIFVGAVLSLDGDILDRREVAVPASHDEVVGVAIELARTLVSAADRPVLGIGIGSPGVVDDAGVVLAAPAFGWERFDLQGIVAEALGLPVTVANDANAAVLAEYTFGGAGDDVILVKVDRGVGAGLMSGGEPLRGSRHAAGEIGHVTVGTDGGPHCPCGKVGCLEAWIAVPQLSKRLGEASGEAAESVLRDAGERLGIALAPVVGALDLSEVVLSGPPELLSGVFAEAAAQTLRVRTLAEFHDDIRVRTTGQGQDIVLRGTAVMVLSERLGVS